MCDRCQHVGSVQRAFFIARISQKKISDFARPSHASFKTQVEAQIAICTKPGTNPAHTPKNPLYARRKKKNHSSTYKPRGALPGL